LLDAAPDDRCGIVFLAQRRLYSAADQGNLLKTAFICSMKRWVSPVLFLLLILAFLAFRYCQHRSRVLVPVAGPTPTQSVPGNSGPVSTAKVPAYVLDVLNFVRKHGEAPDNYVGGREFQNKEGRLPKKDGQGHKLHYSEWDVRPKVQGQNRGPERLVTGSDHSAWYTILSAHCESAYFSRLFWQKPGCAVRLPGFAGTYWQSGRGAADPAFRPVPGKGKTGKTAGGY